MIPRSRLFWSLYVLQVRNGSNLLVYIRADGAALSCGVEVTPSQKKISWFLQLSHTQLVSWRSIPDVVPSYKVADIELASRGGAMKPPPAKAAPSKTGWAALTSHLDEVRGLLGDRKMRLLFASLFV